MIANIVGYIKSDIVGLKNLFLAVGQPKAILKNKNPFPIYHTRWRSRFQNDFNPLVQMALGSKIIIFESF